MQPLLAMTAEIRSPLTNDLSQLLAMILPRNLPSTVRQPTPSMG
jgi:hypothetical protein